LLVTIFLGGATPTEGGAMGALGAIAMALARRRLTWSLLRQALNSTTKLSSFVLFILIGATIFGLVFQGVDGPIWVEHLLTGLPGGQVGFLIVVNVLIFILAFFLDFFELSFIVVPLLAPVAQKLGIDLVWFGVLLAVNMQTSFMHPPFGFALFFLRSVAPDKAYTDRITHRQIEPVTTMQIYWGAVPFVIIQIVMVGLIIAFPTIVSGNLEKAPAQDMDRVRQQMERMLNQQEQLSVPDPAAAPAAAPAQPGTAPDAGAVPDPEPAAEAPAVSDEDMLKQLQQGPAK
jgi:GntP family gluconate:H+ symporter